MTTIDIDWSTAEVHDRELVVELSPRPAPDWRTRAKGAIELLQRPGRPWDTVKVKKDRVVVRAVAVGAEDDVRHFLESIVLQANSPDADRNGDERGDDTDERMTAAFRAFAQ